MNKFLGDLLYWLLVVALPTAAFFTGNAALANLTMLVLFGVSLLWVVIAFGMMVLYGLSERYSKEQMKGCSDSFKRNYTPFKNIRFGIIHGILGATGHIAVAVIGMICLFLVYVCQSGLHTEYQQRYPEG